MTSMSSCRHFEFHDILSATENFDESLVIGHGGFGKVYKGNIMDGTTSVVAAIKRLDSMSTQGAAEFWAEVETLSKLRHCNLVSMIGYCNHGKEMILVYEYMPNGTLKDHLHKLGDPLTWLQRLKICIGAGRGLHYLHTGTGIESGVIHRDVKSSNILLHESWAAKISDFGLSKIGPTNQPKTYVNTLIKGTFGYLDPDYYATGKLTRKSDVYAFGVVMLELLCRRRALDRSLDEEQMNLARWVQESIKEGNLKNIVDSDIRGELAPKSLKEFVRIAEGCLHTNTKQRLTMAQVLVGLDSVLILQEKYNNNLLQPAGRTLLGRMVNMLPFSSNGENSAQGRTKLSSDNKGNNGRASNIIGEDNNTLLDTIDSKLSSDNKGNIGRTSNIVVADKNMLLDTIEHPADYKISYLLKFKIDVLRKSTNDFSEDMIIGEGGFGRTYLGWVNESTFTPSKHRDGVAVAVKRFHFKHEHAKWLEEVSFLGQLAHPNIVTLLGYCSDESKQCLVFEYMPNKSFDRFIFTDIPNHLAEPLSWKTRLMIMIGVARGLVYLHSLKGRIFHYYLNGANILLDEEFNTKLGGFSFPNFLLWDWNDIIRDVSQGCLGELGGTYGYVDPEYAATGRFSVKNEIYSFGVVLLEALTGLRVIDEKRPTKKKNLVDWARPILEKRKTLKKIMDPRLEQNYPVEGAFHCAKIALRCLSRNPKCRPSSEEVLQSLEQILSNSMTA